MNAGQFADRHFLCLTVVNLRLGLRYVSKLRRAFPKIAFVY